MALYTGSFPIGDCCDENYCTIFSCECVCEFLCEMGYPAAS